MRYREFKSFIYGVVSSKMTQNEVHAPFEPTVEALEQALRIQVERNIELQSMLKDSNISKQSIIDHSVLRDVIQARLVSYHQNIGDKHLAGGCHSYLSDITELLEGFLLETRPLPQDTRQSSSEKIDDRTNVVMYRRDVIWFVEEIRKQFDELKKAYDAERRAIKTWTDQSIDLIQNMETLLNNQDSVTEIYSHHIPHEYHHWQGLVKEKEIHASILEGVILSLQEQLVNHGLHPYPSSDFPDGVSTLLEKGEENLFTNLASKDLRLQYIFKKMQRTIAKQREELASLHHQGTQMAASGQSSDVQDQVITRRVCNCGSQTEHAESNEWRLKDDNDDSCRSDEDINKLHMQLLELQRDHERLKIKQKKQEEEHQKQEDASRIRLIYLERMVRLLESKRQEDRISRRSSNNDDSQVFTTPSKDFRNDNRSETSLLSANPKFFSFTRFSTPSTH